MSSDKKAIDPKQQSNGVEKTSKQVQKQSQKQGDKNVNKDKTTPQHAQNKQNAQNAQNKQQHQPTQPKQLRRIAQRSQMPTDKGQLILYLSQRIKQAQDALNDTEDLLEQQIKQRQKITKSLDERNIQLSKLYQVDQRGLPEKIKQKLNQILTMTVTQKIQAQQKLNQQKLKNYQYKQRYDQLKWDDKNNKVKLQDQQKKYNQLTDVLATLNAQNKQHQQQLQALQLEYTKVREQKQKLQNKYLQMKVALDRMGDIKGVLNRFFTNQDLFDQKMDLKEQKIQRLPQPAKDSPLPPPSRDSKGGKQGLNASRLKPIQKGKNDDQDFWKADFKGKNSVF